MIETAGHECVRVVRLNRPPMNALNFDLVAALTRAVEDALSDPRCEAIVLTGLPGLFSAGIDTREVPHTTLDVAPICCARSTRWCLRCTVRRSRW